MLIGDSEHEGEGIPAIDENTVIDKLDEEGNNTYYLYAKTAATENYKADMSNFVELTVSNDVASVTTSSGVTNNYTSLDDALDAVKDGDTVTLLSDVDLGETYVTIDKSITFDLGDKTLSSSKEWLLYGVLVVKDATVTVKNGAVCVTDGGENPWKLTHREIHELLLSPFALDLQERAPRGWFPLPWHTPVADTF